MTLYLSTLAFAIFFALSPNSDTVNFYTPHDIMYGKDGVLPYAGQRIQLAGIIAPDSVKRCHTSLEIQFDLFDKDATMHIIFNGVVPDLFEEEQWMVAKGVLQGNNTLLADTILAIPRGNYTPHELEKVLKENGRSTSLVEVVKQTKPLEKGK